jgi:zinc protease
MPTRSSSARNLLAALLFATFVATVSARSADSAIPTHDHITNGGVTSYTLANGFKVILVPYPSAGQAKVSLVIRSGSKVEGYGETGMAHLLEHMIYMGAGKRKSVKEDLTRLNASWNGTTAADRTNYFATIPADQKKLEDLIRIKADMFLDPRFTEADLKREMTVVRNEMEIGENSAGSLAVKTLMRQSFVWHGYGRPTIGARSDVEKAPFYALQAFHGRNYRPDNAFLLVAGTFDQKPTVELINQLFSKAKNPTTPKPPSWTREEIQPLNAQSEVFMPSGTTLAMSAWKLPPAINRETTAFQLASQAICSNEWGALRKRLVVERKVADFASCSTNPMSDATLFVVAAGGGKDGDPEAMRMEAVAVIEEMAIKGISQEELDRARLESINQAERTMLSMQAFSALLEVMEVMGDWRYLFTDIEDTRDIKLDEANAALRKWITPYGRSEVIVRHRDKVDLPKLPEADSPVIAGKSWPPVTAVVGRKPVSWQEFKAAVQPMDLGDAKASGALIQRKTNGDKVWLQLKNRYGNQEYLRDNGLACSVASSLFSHGGGGMDRDALDKRMEGLNATWSIGPEGLSLSVKKANLDAALDVLIKAWMDPLLPEAEFNQTRQSMISSVDTALTDPDTVADKQLAFRFDNYPEGHPGKPKTFDALREERRNLTYGKVRSCAEDTKGLADSLFVVTGDISQDEFVRIWETRFKPLPKSQIGYERVRSPKAPEKIDTTDILVEMPNKPNGTITAQGMIPIIQADPVFPALRLAFLALGDGTNSRLFKRLREKEGLSYSVDASLSPNTHDPRTTWFITASVASPDYKKAMIALREELAKVIAEGFTEDELARVRSSWLEGRKKVFSGEAGYSGYVASLMHNETSFDFLIEYDRRIATISVAEVNAAFRKYVSMENMVWSAGVGSN